MGNKNKLYEVASRIAIKYGGRTNSLYTDRRIREFWSDDQRPAPTTEYLKKATTIPYLKWTIRNKIKCKDKIWNADFLHGFTSGGKIKWNERSFPRFEWYGNDRLSIELVCSPFGGLLNKAALEATGQNQRSWLGAPSLYLPYDVDSISFMAGVMASGEIVNTMGEVYVKYKASQFEHFQQWGIPIEHKRVRYFLVSAIWPALFSLYMPPSYKNHFIVKGAFKGSVYAPVLWRMYLKKAFVTKGIPYLKSRRQIYTDHQCEEGVTRRLEMLRLRLGLINLDDRIKKAVRRWSKSV
jgi:hypothetical protein